MIERPSPPRIVSASRRTDIPAFYSEWFRRRLEAGWCQVANPFSGKTSLVSLRPEDVLAWVFWSRDYTSFLDVLDRLHHAEQRFLCHFTITGFPDCLEPRTIAPAKALDQARDLARRFGERVVQWRYDPVLLSSTTPPEWHIKNFTRLAEGLRGAVRRCLFSFPCMYRKTIRNLARLSREQGEDGFRVWSPGESDPARGRFDRGDLRRLAEEMQVIASENDMGMQICCGPAWVPQETAVTLASCIDWPLLRELGAGSHLAAGRLGAGEAQPDLFASREGRHAAPEVPGLRRQPSREGCGCWSSIDIGAYESCGHGCAYCYAVESSEAGLKRTRSQDPSAPRLGG